MVEKPELVDKISDEEVLSWVEMHVNIASQGGVMWLPDGANRKTVREARVALLNAWADYIILQEVDNIILKE